MNIRQTLAIKDVKAYAAGSQATYSDSRKADEQVKKLLDEKNQRLNDLRVRLHNLLDHPPELDEYMRPEMKISGAEEEIDAAFRVDKSATYLQNPDKVASGGKWAVVTPEDEILSTWATEEEAKSAAYAFWKGIAPSSTGATAGARVKLVSQVVHALALLDHEEKRLLAGGPGSGRHQDLDRLKDSIFKDGKPRECYENARREYWLHKRAGGNPVYHVGTVVGFSNEDDLDKKAAPLPHAWVEENGKIYDATPFKHGIGNFDQLPEESAKSHWKKAEYKSSYTVDEKNLGNKLSYFPEVKAADIFDTPEIMEQGRSKFIKHPKPKAVQYADDQRMGDRRPSSHGQGSAGTGGTGGPSGS